MPPLPVIEHLHILKDLAAPLLARVKYIAQQQLPFQGRKNDSTTELSKQSPFLPILGTVPPALSAARYWLLVQGDHDPKDGCPLLVGSALKRTSAMLSMADLWSTGRPWPTPPPSANASPGPPKCIAIPGGPYRNETAVQTVFGCPTSKRRCTESSAMRWAWSLLVVPLYFLRSSPFKPAAAVNRATRRREQGWPFSRSSTWTLGTP